MLRSSRYVDHSCGSRNIGCTVRPTDFKHQYDYDNWIQRGGLVAGTKIHDSGEENPGRASSNRPFGSH